MSILHPVGDGFALGTLQIVGGNGDGVTRFEVLSPSRDDSEYVSLSFAQAVGFDVFMQARNPIALGDGVLRGRFAVIGGSAGIELAVSLWGANPLHQNDDTYLVASTKNFTVWHGDFQEYALQLLASACDKVAAFMGELWIRTAIVSAPGGVGIPVLGVSSIWLEVPNAADSVIFNDAGSSSPVENTPVTVSTFSGRSAQARLIGGEWYDEATGLPFERDKHELGPGADGVYQAPRQVKGWG